VLGTGDVASQLPPGAQNGSATYVGRYRRDGDDSFARPYGVVGRTSNSGFISEFTNDRS
jgi:hypothetical protein